MTVARILTKKGRDVATTSEDRTLQEISVDLTRRGIGALVVVNSSGSIVGIISERDIMAAIADRGAEGLSDPVARHMTKNPKVAAEDDTVHSTMETMTIGRFRHLPVINGGDSSGSYPLATWSSIGSKRSNTNIRRCEIISPRPRVLSAKVDAGFVFRKHDKTKESKVFPVQFKPEIL